MPAIPMSRVSPSMRRSGPRGHFVQFTLDADLSTANAHLSGILPQLPDRACNQITDPPRARLVLHHPFLRLSIPAAPRESAPSSSVFRKAPMPLEADVDLTGGLLI